MQPRLRRLRQADWNVLYVKTLDDPHYHPLVAGERHFRLNLLLHDFHFFPSLEGLSFRHLNLRHADFGGLNIDGLDLNGAACHWADFTQAEFDTLKFDSLTRFFEAKFTTEQLLRLDTETLLEGV